MVSRRWIALVMLAAGLVAVPMADAASHRRGPAPEVATMQMGLRMLGYDPGLIDGLEGPRTVAALDAYAADRGIVLNQGTVDLVLALLRAETRDQLLNDRQAGEGEEQGGWSRMTNLRRRPIRW